MNIAATFPGKFGDLLWALPTVRAISETYNQPVSLILSSYLRPIVPLLALQPYIQHVTAYEPWHVQMTAPMSPRVPPAEFNFDRIFHLGLDGWPLSSLPYEAQEIWLRQYQNTGDPHEPLAIDLSRPWISIESNYPEIVCAVGFTDEHFELKYGLWQLLTRYRLTQEAGGGWQSISATDGSRWHLEGGHSPCDWLLAARVIKNAQAFLGCCSALHVLACALGKQTIVVEPNEHRWHPIFHPEAVRDRVHLVHGTDGRPTFDARHVRAELEKFTRA